MAHVYRKARRAWPCSLCVGSIRPGEVYCDHSGGYWRECIRCIGEENLPSPRPSKRAPQAA